MAKATIRQVFELRKVKIARGLSDLSLMKDRAMHTTHTDSYGVRREYWGFREYLPSQIHESDLLMIVQQEDSITVYEIYDPRTADDVLRYIADTGDVVPVKWQLAKILTKDQIC